MDGIDEVGLAGWFAEHVPGARPPFDYTLIAGGHSNLTYRVADADGQLFVLRRPPLGELLPSAHDMTREHRIMAALGPSPVPVPEMVGLCTDESVTGRPFYVMRYVDGLVRDPKAVAQVSEMIRWAAAESLVDGLVALHGLDPDACGLGELGRREGYVERLLRRWRQQWDTARQRDLPLLEEVGDRLARSVPEAGPARVVHGDYRLDNVMIDPATGAVRAVLDGAVHLDMADLGMLVVYWTEPDDTFSPLLNAPTVATGFPRRDQVVAWYVAKSGRDVSELHHHVALGTWKLAMVLEGVYNRYNSGAYGETDGEWRRFDRVIPALAESAHEAAQRAGR